MCQHLFCSRSLTLICWNIIFTKSYNHLWQILSVSVQQDHAKKLVKFHPTNSIRQSKCAWLTVTVWENNLKQFKDSGTKRIKKHVTFIGWIEVTLKLGLLCYLKWAKGKEWSRTYFILKAYSVKVVREN